MDVGRKRWSESSYNTHNEATKFKKKRGWHRKGGNRMSQENKTVKENIDGRKRDFPFEKDSEPLDMDIDIRPTTKKKTMRERESVEDVNNDGIVETPETVAGPTSWALHGQ